MSEQNPATPAQAATPGSDEQKPNTPSAQTPSTTQGDQGTQPEGKVTISTKEYAQLQRDSARVRSFERRKEFISRRNSQANNPQSGGQVDEEIQRLTQENEATQRELYREKVTNRVRNILDKPEYAALPKSTRELILKNPAMLSEADDVEEALLDIEDFVLEQVAGLAPQTTQQKTGDESKKTDPPGHETPPNVNAGAPAQTDNAGLEDLTNLRGSARSRAALRNAIKKARGVSEVK